MYREHNTTLRCARGFYQIVRKTDSICGAPYYLQVVNYFFNFSGSAMFLFLPRKRRYVNITVGKCTYKMPLIFIGM
jgi:hypothetical protein